MVLYELKKLLSRPGGKIPFILLTVLLAVTCYFAVSAVGYVDENGNEERGIEAVRKRREAKKEWRGNLTEERIAEVIRENRRINESPEGQSQEVREQNKAYYRKQGFSDIRSLIINSYGAFREYDYYLIDELEPERAGEFYKNRVKQLENWLNTEAKDWYTQREKDFFLQRYEMMPQPLFYDYAQGWRSVFEYAPTIQTLMVFILGFLLSGMFAKEKQWKADQIFFTSYYGRNKAVAAKIKAGVLLATVVYVAGMSAYTLTVLGIFGTDGAGCLIQSQTYGWKSFHYLTNLQLYMLILTGGYIGTLVFTLLTLLISAKTKSSVPAAIVSFGLIFLPAFLAEIPGSFISKITGLLPDQLLQMNMVVNLFNLYEVGGSIVSAIPILLVVYGVMAVVLLPLIYGVYRKSQVQ